MGLSVAALPYVSTNKHRTELMTCMKSCLNAYVKKIFFMSLKAQFCSKE